MNEFAAYAVERGGLGFEDVDALIGYDPESGNLYWKERPVELFASQGSARRWNSRYAGRPVGYLQGAGYVKLAIRKVYYEAHRIAWLLQYREWPAGQIDHINGVRHDNRIKNLRVVSHAENGRNQRLRSTSTSGVMGVVWYRPYSKWNARITVSGRDKNLGYFNDFQEAVATRKAAERQYGFHRNHGRKS